MVVQLNKKHHHHYHQQQQQQQQQQHQNQHQTSKSNSAPSSSSLSLIFRRRCCSFYFSSRSSLIFNLFIFVYLFNALTSSGIDSFLFCSAELANHHNHHHQQQQQQLKPNRIDIFINTFDGQFNLELSPVNADEFLSPSLMLKNDNYDDDNDDNDDDDDYTEDKSENIIKNRNSNIIFNRSRSRSRLSSCFYAGYVNSEERSSSASINLCKPGQVLGRFRLFNAEYFIEPYQDDEQQQQQQQHLLHLNNQTTTIKLFVNETNGTYYEEQLNAPHIVYRNHLIAATINDDKNDEIESTTTTTTTTAATTKKNNNLSSLCEILGVNEFEEKKKKNKNKNEINSFGESSSRIRSDRRENVADHEQQQLRRLKRSSNAAAPADHPDHSYIIDRKVYLELMVVVDKEMASYYGSDLENHVLTVMFLATQMYQHPSIINPIRVFITDIIYLSKLNETVQEDLEIVWDAERTLNSFCHWQTELRAKTKSSASVDAAILLTRHDICKSKDICQTLGMARLGQVCVPGHHCAVIEDSGINTAFTISHEIGHLIGMTHVDESSRCSDVDPDMTQMMAPMLDLTKSSYEWSNCSIFELNNFLRTEDAFCLFNKPTITAATSAVKSMSKLLSSSSSSSVQQQQQQRHHQHHHHHDQDINDQFSMDIKTKAHFPGQMYDLKKQCQHIFGPESDACEQNLDDECKILWCKADTSTDLFDSAIHCVTTNTKWADGTPCGHNGNNYHHNSNNNNKICLNGKCVVKTRDNVRVVDGGWSEWSSFSKCSRTCGGGVRRKVRTCDNPAPKNGGKYCRGERVKYESCETHECPKSEPDFRDMQCEIAAKKAFERNSLKLSGFESSPASSWKAYHSQDPKNRCKLICKPANRTNFVVLGLKVVDGTKCSPDSFDICVNGICLQGGCDNKLYSNKTMDNCGVCDGDDSICTRVHYRLDIPTTYGYNDLIDIPARASNIIIRRFKHSDDDLGCLALRIGNSSLINGLYIISKMPTSVDVHGTQIYYIVNSSVEIIKSSGNFNQSLRLQFLAGDTKKRRQNGYIEFSYFMPNNEKKVLSYQQQQQSSLAGAGAAAVSRVGGGGFTWIYTEQQLSTSMNSSQCDRMCNGKMRVKMEAKCMRNETMTQVDDRYCAASEKKRKTSTYVEKACNTNCNLRVEVAEWKCAPRNGVCGVGVKMPVQFYCIRIDKDKAAATNSLTSSSKVVDLSNCNRNQMDELQNQQSRCEIPCDRFKWKEFETECSVSCGDGHKYRYYQCVDHLSGGQLVNASYCSYMGSSSRPKDEYVPCSMNDCPASWAFGEWSECSFPCKTSRRRRQVYCTLQKQQQQQPHQQVVVDNSFCNGLMKPSEVEECAQESCAVWNMTSWSQCSATCGTGHKIRIVYCQLATVSSSSSSSTSNNGNLNSNKNDDATTASAALVDTYSAYKYRAFRSAYMNTRSLQDYVEKKVDDSECDPRRRPPHLTECNSERPCPEWKSSDWSPCSVSCGRGVRTRTVYCSDSSDNCKSELKPHSIEACGQSDCVSWEYGNWSKCVGSCSNGWKTRPVNCVDNSGNNVAFHKCPRDKKPINRQKCTDNCGEWRAVGNWSECSSKCGEGYQLRTVACYSINLNEPIESTHCDHSKKPKESQSCKNECYLKGPEWSIVAKEKCSATCGQGWRFRIIECKYEDGTMSDLCEREKRPEYYEICDAGECPDWDYGSWSACSTACGEGVKRRLIVCRYSNGSIVDDSNCHSDVNTRPSDTITCFEYSCADWIASAWSECNPRTCTMIRKVECALANGTRVPEYSCDESKKPNYVAECSNRHFKCGSSGSNGVGGSGGSGGSGGDIYATTVISTAPSYSSLSPTFPSSASPSSPSNAVVINKLSMSYPGILDYTNWTKCSAKCGDGVRTREPICRSRDSLRKLPLSACGDQARLRVENLSMGCNLAKCEYVVQQKWSNCSGSCNKKGVETLMHVCYEKVTKTYVDMKLCGDAAVEKQLQQLNGNKTETRVCSVPCKHHHYANLSSSQTQASVYQWKFRTWSKCSGGSCGLSKRTREVYCYNLKNKTVAATETFCNQKDRPIDTVPCMNSECGYGWFVSQWSQCSKKCSQGVKKREVKCVRLSSKGYMIMMMTTTTTTTNSAEMSTAVLSNKCKLSEKPAEEMPCNYGHCFGKYSWRVGNWSKCLATCGFGYQTRTVECINDNNKDESSATTDDNKCVQPMPLRSQLCYSNCYANSCARLKTEFGFDLDGEYELNLSMAAGNNNKGKLVSIYCKNMQQQQQQTTKPEEFLTLRSGESQNYAEIYDKKLIEPNRCRFGPRYNTNCPFCLNETVENHGITLFSKVRIDLQRLTIVQNDFSFAKIAYGSPVPYGTAGDCFSSEPNCQHGRLSLNLRGTGFVISNETNWINYGENSRNKINITKDNTIVYGICGGTCGFCKPDPSVGIKLKVIDRLN